MKVCLVALLLVSATPAFADPPPPINFLVPPTDATRFTLLSTSARHGQTFVWTDKDGRRCSREARLEKLTDLVIGVGATR